MERYLTIGFVRRGFSRSGGAESYLKRLAAGVVAKGHQARLFCSDEWPAEHWVHGAVTRLDGKSNTAFADELEKLAPHSECDVLMSLERVWRCDVYRAGDGVHRAWLDRRAAVGGPFRNLGRILNRKHSTTLALEHSLLAEGGAGRVIVNSKMVRDEIVRFHGYSADRIDVIHNGVPIDAFRWNEENRRAMRERLGLGDKDIGVLFAGSGWERKGLRFAIEAISRCGKPFSLLIAGRGDERGLGSANIRFLGEVEQMPAVYSAADIFVLPTIYDPFSNACLEALASGLPVVTTSSNGFAEIIQANVHGTVVDDPRNIDAICEALIYWADNARREQARIENAALARQFDISKNVDQTLQVLTTFGPRI
jgi:UDP-glucose:(heptosyl)LPS alpha-1,3-glucosyltransferase